MDKKKSYLLDGSFERQQQAAKEMLESLTPEQARRSMSDEFAYLDEEPDDNTKK